MDQKKTQNKKSYFFAFFISILSILFIYFMGKNVDLKIIAKSHFNIITINTVIIGFLFTSLSILLSFLDKKLIDYLEDIEYMGKVFKRISFGMVLACVTISVCLINLLFITDDPLFPCWQNYLLALEVILVIYVFINFNVALFNINIVIREVRKIRRKERKQEKANKEFSSLK